MSRSTRTEAEAPCRCAGRQVSRPTEAKSAYSPVIRTMMLAGSPG